MSGPLEEFRDAIRRSWAEHQRREGETREEERERFDRQFQMQSKLQAEALYKLLEHKSGIEILISIIDKRDGKHVLNSTILNIVLKTLEPDHSFQSTRTLLKILDWSDVGFRSGMEWHDRIVKILAAREHPWIARKFRKIVRNLVENPRKYIDSWTWGYIGYTAIPTIVEYLMKYKKYHQGLLEDYIFLFEYAVFSKNGEDILNTLSYIIPELIENYENPNTIIENLSLEARELLGFL
jgi:hypothetical protein